MNLRQIVDSALGMVFPARCALCGREGRLVCESCRQTFPQTLDPDACPKLSGIRATRAVWPYEGAVREIVRRYKYNGLRSLAPTLAEEMGRVLHEWSPPVSLIVNVPAHPARLRERGFDQSEVLARELSRVADIPAVPALTRLGEAAAQARSESASQRARNVRDAFHLDTPDSIRGAHILLIDDVLTTGATLTECARTLRRAGAARVHALTLAHET